MPTVIPTASIISDEGLAVDGTVHRPGAGGDVTARHQMCQSCGGEHGRADKHHIVGTAWQHAGESIAEDIPWHHARARGQSLLFIEQTQLVYRPDRCDMTGKPQRLVVEFTDQVLPSHGE